MRERAILVTVGFDSMRRQSGSEGFAKELEELSRSAGLTVTQSLVLRQKRPNAPLLLGSGRAAELRGLAEKERADVVVFAIVEDVDVARRPTMAVVDDRVAAHEHVPYGVPSQ